MIATKFGFLIPHYIFHICSVSVCACKCCTCLNGLHNAWKSRSGGPIALSLTDQHFPPNIPADESGECIRVLRVEDGSVAELADELLRIAPREGLPKGSNIVAEA